jgi:hypothetical protein
MHTTTRRPAVPAHLPGIGRSQAEILKEIAANKGRGAKLRRKLAANKERNWLLALVLHSFAKVDSGSPLSDLEQMIVSAFRDNGFSDDEIRGHGRQYKALSRTVRASIFPEQYATLSHASYTLTRLKKDLPTVQRNILKMPNIAAADLGRLRKQGLTLRHVAFPSVDVIKKFGAGGTVLLDIGRIAPPKLKCAIKATKFTCNDETGPDWWGSDEPYWIFGSLGGGTPITTRSKVFTGVDSGESRTFDAHDGCIWGHNCLPEELPDHVGVLVSLWEHDYGDPAKIQAGVAAAFAAAAGILAATGVAAWIAAVVAGVGAIVQWLLSFLDDDHIADQTFVFSRSALEAWLHEPKGAATFHRRFTDGDGDYTLEIVASRA